MAVPYEGFEFSQDLDCGLSVTGPFRVCGLLEGEHLRMAALKP